MTTNDKTAPVEAYKQIECDLRELRDTTPIVVQRKHFDRLLAVLPALRPTEAESEGRAEGLQEDLRQLIRVAVTNPGGLQEFIAMNYPKEFAEFAEAQQLEGGALEAFAKGFSDVMEGYRVGEVSRDLPKPDHIGESNEMVAKPDTAVERTRDAMGIVCSSGNPRLQQLQRRDVRMLAEAAVAALAQADTVQQSAVDVAEIAYAAFVAQLKKEGWSSCDARYIPSEKKAIAAAIAALSQPAHIPVDLQKAAIAVAEADGAKWKNLRLRHDGRWMKNKYRTYAKACAQAWGLPIASTQVQGGGE